MHLPLQPDPRLLTLEDPYDLSARTELEKSGVATPVDFSLYNGKFYLYWGPVPALLLSPIQLFSQAPQPVADFFIAFLFGVGILLAQTLLLTAVWRQYFSVLPGWAYYISLFLAGLIWPVALLRHEHNHARIYEAAIAAGQFFLISGVWMGFTALTKPSIPNGRLALTGLLWALAIGSRNLLLLPIAFMVLLTTLWIVQMQATVVTKIIRFAYLTLPLAMGGALLTWYNWVRFGSITETGYSYQLAGVDLGNHLSELFSGNYVIQNLYNYLLNPPQWMSSFPLVSMLKGNESQGLSFYYAEPMTGLLYMFPFAIFAAVPLFVFLSHRAKTTAESRQHSWNWIILNLSGSFLISFILLLVFFWSGMRYAADFLPSLTALSAIGFWQGFQIFEHKRGYGMTGLILAGISIAVSTLLAISTL